jgi:LysR family hca operon transcriptional activator
MELRLFRYFLAVAEELNFTRAAERLHTAQPSLSQQIRQIEDEVGTPLFHRDRHRVQLTEAGRIFLREARIVLESAERALVLARQAGALTIGLLPGPAAKILPRLAPILAQTNPRLQFVLRTLSSPKQIQALRNREIDVGFIHERIGSEQEQLTSELLFSEPIVAIVPASHALARMKQLPVKNLAELPLIQVEHDFAPVVHDAMNLVGEQAGVCFRTLLETDSLITTLNTVASGLGFSLFGKYVELVLPVGAVAKPLDLNPVPEIEVLVAYRKDDTLPALAIFLKMLREAFTRPLNKTRRQGK